MQIIIIVVFGSRKNSLEIATNGLFTDLLGNNFKHEIHFRFSCPSSRRSSETMESGGRSQQHETKIEMETNPFISRTALFADRKSDNTHQLKPNSVAYVMSNSVSTKPFLGFDENFEYVKSLRTLLKKCICLIRTPPATFKLCSSDDMTAGNVSVVN